MIARGSAGSLLSSFLYLLSVRSKVLFVGGCMKPSAGSNENVIYLHEHLDVESSYVSLVDGFNSFKTDVLRIFKMPLVLKFP